MNCRQARIDLALCVGEDLPEAARRESLRQHVAQCPGCRAHYKRLRGTLQVLESSDRDRTYDVGGSLWPQLSNRIRRLEEAPAPPSRLNGWLPFVAVTAACALLVVVIDVQAPPGARPSSAPSVARDILPHPWVPDLTRTEDQGKFLPIGPHPQRMLETESLDQFKTEKARLERNPPQAHD